MYRLPYNLYCVGGDVKHCTIQSIVCTDRVGTETSKVVSFTKADLDSYILAGL